jgi:hypothetical protein
MLLVECQIGSKSKHVDIDTMQDEEYGCLDAYENIVERDMER